MKFEQAGFPIIILNEETFDVKAIDFWEFRTFRYNEVKRIKYYKEGEIWMKYFVGGPGWMHEKFDPFILRIKKTNGGYWDYNCPPKKTLEFSAFLNELRERCAVARKG